ncbi:unnamed protein product [Tilletia controversa]|nr:unnamed protein product [Tilletia controversa]
MPLRADRSAPRLGKGDTSGEGEERADLFDPVAVEGIEALDVAKAGRQRLEEATQGRFLLVALTEGSLDAALQGL